jgi:DNA-directed RNA polymerase alpha subunit
LVFANENTATGATTKDLFTRYIDTVSEESVMLETLDWQPEPGFTPYETLTEAAHLYYEEMEVFVEEESLEAFGAYYIYDYDKSKNYYAVGVFGN